MIAECAILYTTQHSVYVKCLNTPTQQQQTVMNLIIKYLQATHLLASQWNTGGEPELISVLHTDAQLQRSCPQCNLHVA